MKIAVPAKSNSLQSEVDQRFARAEGFIIYDSDTKEFEFIENSMPDAHGAGPKAVQKLAELEVKVLIIPSVGNNAFEAINASNMKAYFSVNGSIEKNLQEYFNGNLEEIKGATR